MKKIILLILFLTVLTSCKKDDSNPVTADNGLVGTWVLTNISGTTTSQGAISIPPSQAGISMTIVFNSNKTCTITTVQQGQTTNETDNWSTSNGKITFTPVTGGGTAMVLPYTQTGNKVNVDFSSLISSITSPGVTFTQLMFEFTKQ
jgi:hypothetical protein